jgi:hypothetical protein
MAANIRNELCSTGCKRVTLAAPMPLHAVQPSVRALSPLLAVRIAS